MRILYIFTSKFHQTGITSTVMNYYEELITYKDVTIDFLIPNKPSENLSKRINKQKSNIFILNSKLRIVMPLLYIRKLIKIMQANNYDIVHVHGSSSIMALELYSAKRAKIKIRVAHSHNTTTQHPIIHRMLYKQFQKNCTSAFACGKKAGKWLFGKRKFYVVPNAQKINNFQFDEKIRKEYRAKYNLNKCIVIGHVGSFNYQKNHEFLIRVFKKLADSNPRYRLILIGGGKLEKRIKEMVHLLKLDEKVIFTGTIPATNKWLNACDIMALPSRYEGLPNVLIEWQINGLPCIVSKNITKEVKLTDSVFFEDLSENKWVNRINNMKRTKKKRYDNAQIIRKSGYDIEESSKKLYTKYKELIENAEGRK